jgi:hypothetical protein
MITIMNVTTHPSNPPADAIDFSTELSEPFELAYWKQISRPNVQNTNDAAYKVLKFGDQYMVIWARKIISK